MQSTPMAAKMNKPVPANATGVATAASLVSMVELESLFTESLQ